MIYLILVFAFVIRLIRVDQSFWLDEAAQIIVSRQPLFYFLQNMPGDFHPPLFYILTHFWLYLGQGEVVTRLLPILIGIASIYVSYLLGKKIFDEKVGLISAAILSINPFHIYFSQEFRPYILSCLLGGAVIYFFYRALRDSKFWWGYFISGSLFLYTTYLAPFLLVSFFIVLIFLKKYKDFRSLILFTTLIGVSFIPWLPELFSQLKVSSVLMEDLPGWTRAVSTPALKALPLTVTKFLIGQINFRPYEVYAVIVGGLIIIYGGLIIFSKSWKDINWLKLVGIFLITLIISSIFTFFLPVVAPKRMIFLLPVVVVILGYTISRFKGLPYYASVAFITLSSLFFWGMYITNTDFQREDWRGSVEKIEEKAIPENKSLVIFKFSGPFAPYLLYSKNNIRTASVAPRLKVENRALDSYLADEKNVFVYRYLGELTDPEFLTEKHLEEKGYIKKDTFDFKGVGLVDFYQR